MLKPVPAIGLCLAGYAALNVYARGGSATSSEARVVQDAASAVVDSAERSQVLFGEKAECISQLKALANECMQQGWDGDEACALDPLAVFIAETFVRALPDGIPLPELAPEPDGSISLDWIQSQRSLFTLSVSSSNRLACAWIDGADKGHAVAGFDGEHIPRLILQGITGIMGHGNAPIRIA